MVGAGRDGALRGRGRSRLQDRRRSFGLRRVSARRRARHVASGLDHDPLDSSVEHVRGGEAGVRLRRGTRRRPSARRRGRRSARRSQEVRARASRGARGEGRLRFSESAIVRRSTTTTRSTATRQSRRSTADPSRSTGKSSPPTSSSSIREPGSSTKRPPSARSITSFIGRSSPATSIPRKRLFSAPSLRTGDSPPRSRGSRGCG